MLALGAGDGAFLPSMTSLCPAGGSQHMAEASPEVSGLLYIASSLSLH